MIYILGTTLLSYNFKGGVGKTTFTAMEGWIMANQNKKVLLVDFDPQANLTKMIEKTFNKKLIPKVSILQGLLNHDLTNTLVHASKNIDLLPSDWSLSKYVIYCGKIPKNRRFFVLDYLLKPFKNNYNYILVDVPPTFGIFSNNAIFAADGISIVLQTQAASFSSAIKTVQQLSTFRKDFHTHFTFLGVILYLYTEAKVDRDIAKESKETFEGVLYVNKIKEQERLHGFMEHGIRDHDRWDKRAIAMYKMVVLEMENKVGKMISQ